MLWYDVHTDTIRVLQQSVKRIVIAHSFMETLPRYMSFVATTIHHRLESMKVLAELSKHATTRDVIL